MPKKIPFYKSLTFKLTIWYSAMLFIFALILLTVMNIAVTNILSEEPASISHILQALGHRNPGAAARFEDLQQEEQERIQALREEELARFRQWSFYSLLPILLVSFIGGYAFSHYMFRPIRALSVAAEKAKLGDRTVVPYDSEGDELSELIRSFNRMTERFSHTYDMQAQFIEDASHELKTPLAVMQTNMDTVLYDTAAKKDELRQALNKGLDSVQNMNELIEDLLLLARDEKLSLTAVDINTLIGEVVQELNPLAKEQKVTLVFKNDVNDPQVKGEPMMLKRIFTNLIENGIKYSAFRKNARVSITVDVKGDEAVHIQIADNGIGIPRHTYEKIFDRFYRVDKSRSRKSGGFGLGLSIVRKFVDLHEGEITLKSVENKGSTFTVILPLYAVSISK